jgi:signal peptidase II
VKKSHYVLLIIFTLLFLDQALKIWVKLNMPLGDSFKVFGLEWFQIRFTENRGMAFGMELGGDWGKLVLSLFRIVVVAAMGYFIVRLVRKNSSYLLLTCIAFIFAGALGNILDSIFYGVVFSDSGTFHSPRIAEFLPDGGGYAPVLFGEVVDMLYFPLYEGNWPPWVPFVGGDYLLFFRPIFNIADSAISVGVVLALLFYRRLQAELEPPVATEADDSAT